MADTIKEFLVSLGWQSNDAQHIKFTAMLEGATLRAKLLGDGLEEVARKVADSVKAVAEDFEKLYYQSIRTGQSAASIKDFAYAVSQLGGTAEGAVGSLEAMGQKLRENPGYIRYLNQLGFGLNKITGQLEYQQDLAEKAARMPIWQAKQFASQVGLDERTLMAMRQAEEFRVRYAESQKSMNAAGLDATKAAADAKEFQQAQRQLFNDLGNDYDSLVTTMTKSLTPGLKELDAWLHEKQPEIVEGIKEIGKGVTAIVDGIKYVVQLDEESKSWTIMRLFNNAANPNGPGTINAPPPVEVPIPEDPRGAGSWGSLGKWLGKSLGGGGKPEDDAAKAKRLNDFSDAFGIPRGLSVGGKDISLERATDGGKDGTAFGTNSGAPRDVGNIKVNGSAVTSGNPLPVTLDTSGFGSPDGSSGSFFGAIGDAIGAGARRLFGGGNGSGGASDNYGSGSSHVPKAEGIKRAAHLIDHLMSKYGVSREEAIGAAGVMGYESGDFTTMQEKGQAPGRGGWGYAQWTGPRRRNFFNWFRRSGLTDPSSVEANEGFLDYELAHGFGKAISALKQQTTVQSSALSWEHVFEGMDGSAGIPAFGAHVGRAVAYSKLPQLQPGYFAGSPTGGHFDHSTTHNVVNHKTEIHVDGSQDPEITARMVGSHVHRVNQDLTRDMVGATQ